MLLPQMATCPFCGKLCEIDVDPDGGKRQDYEEDCPECGGTWKVHVRIHGSGSASVSLSAAESPAEEL